MPSAPLSCSSNGVVTVLATTSELAPIYCVETWIREGTSGGYYAKGSTNILRSPARIIIKAMAAANLGRSILSRT